MTAADPLPAGCRGVVVGVALALPLWAILILGTQLIVNVLQALR